MSDFVSALGLCVQQRERGGKERERERKKERERA